MLRWLASLFITYGLLHLEFIALAVTRNTHELSITPITAGVIYVGFVSAWLAMHSIMWRPPKEDS